MRTALTILLSVLSLCLAQAEDAEQGFTFDFGSAGPKEALPSWMTGQPVASPGAHATISFPITPPAGDSDLAVTFYFTETTGGFLRVYWAGAQTSEMLSDNLFEGISMPNQRTLLIKRATLSTPGTLSVQSSEPSLNILRIHWEWVEPATVSIASAAKQTALIDATGGVLGEEEVDGAPALPKPDRIGDSVVTAALTDKPQRIESGVEFVATLQQAPQYARLEVQMAGVPVGKTVKLWVNGALAGEVSLAMPDLNDPGYQAAAAGAPPAYIGWRKGVVYLQAGLLKTGGNRFQFAVQGATADTPLAVKDMLLQLKYEAQAADAPAATPAPDTTPVPAATPAVTPAPTPAQSQPAAASGSAGG